jgi:hypothetical protein
MILIEEISRNFTTKTKAHKLNNLQTPQNFHPSKSTMKLNIFLLSAAAMVNAATAIEPIDLKAAGNYVILAKTSISTVPTSNITGDIGVYSTTTTTITGFDLVLDSEGQHFTSSQVKGKIHDASSTSYGDSVAAELPIAVLDMQNAYTEAESRLSDPLDDRGLNLKGGLIGGQTLTPGVYTFTTAITIYTDLTFDGGFDDIWIIKTTGVLTLAANMEIILLGGAQAKNIFWQVAGNAAIGADASMAGIMLVKTDVAFITGASLNGRILSQTSANLQKATIMTEDEVFC